MTPRELTVAVVAVACTRDRGVPAPADRIEDPCGSRRSAPREVPP